MSDKCSRGNEFKEAIALYCETLGDEFMLKPLQSPYELLPAVAMDLDEAYRLTKENSNRGFTSLELARKLAGIEKEIYGVG